MTLNSHQVRSCSMVLVVFATLLTGCTTWQPTSISPQAIVSEDEPGSIRLTLTNGAVATVVDPVLRNDSILSSSTVLPGIAVEDVTVTEVREFSLRKTIVLVAGGIVAAAAWTSGVVGAGLGGGSDDPPLPKGFAPLILGGLKPLAP